ncbi:hypothetical protein LZG04_14630 [Saccharothrix sp. S26]|uniref:hypothetical protein n=1 Tax=Saccharothrix sp. S26 TaxID=2907215 RepID=UPI001F46BCD2|nr:hypothetical protein [Saccharothrix sp. S26]MCE6996030.1 hypothetical protein [Saccharothrix sp. S26]
MTAWRRWRADARQRRHHRPFRIAAPAWDAAERDRLRAILEAAARVRAEDDAASTGRTGDDAASAGGGEPVGEHPSPLAERELSAAATNLWRARRKIAKSPVADSREGKQVARYLRATQEALDQAGVVIQDHDGTEFHPDLSIEVLAFAEDPALTRDVVVETVRPSVYLGDRRIQMGQVVVGCPDAGGGTP